MLDFINLILKELTSPPIMSKRTSPLFSESSYRKVIGYIDANSVRTVLLSCGHRGPGKGLGIKDETICAICYTRQRTTYTPRRATL